jgi:type I restriction enzyme M protein
MTPEQLSDLEKRLWQAADQLRANSDMKSSEYSVPVLGLIFLRYADFKFAHAEKQLGKSGTGRRKISKTDYQARGALYVPETARYHHLLQLPEGANIGKAISDAMKAIEKENESLAGILPKDYNRFDNALLVSLLKTFSEIPMDIEGDVFGKIYEYFLGEFAMTEGQKGGEFFTPTSIVKLIVEIIEPYHGLILDPACGSGGMFAQSAGFVKRHKKKPSDEISIYGMEKTLETVRLCQMNLAVHGLQGDVKQANTYYEDLFDAPGKFDFVMANPPFNVNGIDKDKIKDQKKRFPFGMPKGDNGNYLWIQLFYSSLNKNGRAGFVMANSASDARASEQEIRRQLIEAGHVDVMISVGSNFFYTVTLPCTLWFLDKGKTKTDRKDKILFIDARNIFHQIDRAHRDFTEEQIDFIANIVRLYRGESLSYSSPPSKGGAKSWSDHFPKGKYRDIPGLCKVVKIKEVESHGWSLNPGRYVGVADKEEDDFDFKERLTELNEELEGLNKEARKLEETISGNIKRILKRN